MNKPVMSLSDKDIVSPVKQWNGIKETNHLQEVITDKNDQKKKKCRNDLSQSRGEGYNKFSSCFTKKDKMFLLQYFTSNYSIILK